MGIFGLGSSTKKKAAAKPKAVKSTAKPKSGAKAGKSVKVSKSAKGGDAEAKALLAKMQAKSDAGDCPFC